MKIGIIGSGNIGGPLGRLWAQAGHDVFFSSRHPETLDGLVRQAGGSARAGTPEDAIAFADVLLEAIPYAAALELPADALAGKTIISSSNYYTQRDGEIDLKGLSQTELVAARLPQTRVVKAFNMMPAGEMQQRADGETNTRLAIFFAGDDEDAKSVATDLITAAHFEPVDTGELASGAIFEHGGPRLFCPSLSPALRDSLASRTQPSVDGRYPDQR